VFGVHYDSFRGSLVDHYSQGNRQVFVGHSNKSHADWKVEIDKSKETLFHVWNRQIEFNFDELVFLKRNLQKLSATV
jgi:hypothetical protein